MATSDELISQIHLRGGFPSQNYYSDAEMLSLLNDEMKLQIVPLIMELQDGYFLQNKDYTITDGGSYRLPKRALANKLRDVKIYDSGSYRDLQQLFEEDRSSGRTGYYISRNSLTLSDDITTGTLRITYFIQPSELILEASAAQITSIDSATQVTVSALPSSITTSTPVDFIQSVGPFDQLALDQTITNISGTTLTFTSLPDDLAVNDYICLAGESPVPVIPEVLHPVLAQAVLCTCLSAKDHSSLKIELQKLEQMKQTMVSLLSPRVESNDIKIKSQGLLGYIKGRR